MKKDKFLIYLKAFRIPVFVLFGLLAYVILEFLNYSALALPISLLTIVLGSYQLFTETIADIKRGQFGLDYIAILALVVSVVTQEYLVGIILALMIASGRNLEEYGASSAKRSLTALAQRIPHDVNVEEKNALTKMAVSKVKIGDVIIVRKGEVVPLDGYLESDIGVVDESSLTGEAYPVDKYKGDILRSGILNVGTVLRIKVSKEEKDSTYKKIVLLVEQAQKEKAPMVRLANKYSLYFTAITILMCTVAYAIHPTLEAILSVLVVATPCPLILATPIALIGGMNSQAKRRTIVKSLASIEALARVDTVVFDKTGTITLGQPKVVEFSTQDTKRREELLAVASAIERNSLHPLAKAVVEYAKKAANVTASNIEEVVGKGIRGDVNGKEYILKKVEDATNSNMQIGIFSNEKNIGIFHFEDQIKDESRVTIKKLTALNLHLKIFTGDKLQTASELIRKLGIGIEVEADLSPIDKQNGIAKLKKEGHTVAMVGDGINDAPALALADVGIVFANEEQTAASEAADIVLLGGNFSSVLESVISSKRTISIAKQSIFAGIGMSIMCMVAASLGLIPPLAGSLIQEAIDVATIVNALRASRN